ncbi:unnamed protein product [Ixodes pacificus]
MAAHPGSSFCELWGAWFNCDISNLSIFLAIFRPNLATERRSLSAFSSPYTVLLQRSLPSPGNVRSREVPIVLRRSGCLHLCGTFLCSPGEASFRQLRETHGMAGCPRS